METLALCSIVALEWLIRHNVVTREVVLEILSSTDFQTPIIACCMKITALLHILKREAACLDLSSVYSLETIGKLAALWNDSLTGVLDAKNQKQIISQIVPDEKLVLDMKLSLIYDRWTGDQEIESMVLKKYIVEVFTDPTDFQKPHLDECVKAAEDVKGSFRKHLFDIASRSTMHERLLAYCTRALNALGQKTMLENIVEDHLNGGYLIRSDNGIFAGLLGATAGAISPVDEPFQLNFPQAESDVNAVIATALKLGAGRNVGTSTGELVSMGRMGSVTSAGLMGVSQQNTANTQSQTASINSDDSLPMTGKDSARYSGRKRRPNNPWSKAEELALKKGIVKYGPGSWSKIHKDHIDVLVRRTQIDLKDKWRNICRNKTDAEIEEMLLELKLLEGIDGPAGMSQR